MNALDKVRQRLAGVPIGEGPHEPAEIPFKEAVSLRLYLDMQEPPSTAIIREWVEQFERRRAPHQNLVEYLHQRLTERHERICEIANSRGRPPTEQGGDDE